MPLIIGGRNPIEPIKWEKYTGETVNTRLVIKNRQKHTDLI